MIYNYIKKNASEVFSRYNGDKDSFELFTLPTFIDNIIMSVLKIKKMHEKNLKM